MAYDLPEVSDVRAAYPEFASDVDYPDDAVQRAIDKAARQVDETWLEADYEDAATALAAHYLETARAAGEAAGQDYLRSISIGPLSLSYGDRLSVAQLSSTPYGQEFQELRRKNIPAVLVV